MKKIGAGLFVMLFFSICFIAFTVVEVGKGVELAVKPKVKLGIDVLLEKKLELVKGKRVGLITNHTGVDSSWWHCSDRNTASEVVREVELSILLIPRPDFRFTACMAR